MARESFRYSGTQELCKLIDEASRRTGLSRGQVFEDFLTCSVCALSNQQMEEEYLEVVDKGYGEGEQGRRGIDSLTQAFAKLIELMEETRKDVIGDLFEGSITYGEAGQFLTPEPICELMAKMTADDQATGETVSDPCCGSGRMLLAYADVARPREVIGQDVDLRCVKMTSLNLALRNQYGYALWGNSLTGECKLGYRTGMNAYGGFIRYMRPGELSDVFEEDEQPTPPDEKPAAARLPVKELPTGRKPDGPERQLELF